MDEFEKELAVEIDGRRYILRYWAINYGTHVGSTLKFFDAGAQSPFGELSFETHWNTPGRYILRIGACKGEQSHANISRILQLAGANVLKSFADLFAPATSLDNVFARVKANANAIAWAGGAALAADWS